MFSSGRQLADDDDDILNLMEFAINMIVGATHELYIKSYDGGMSIQQDYDYTQDYLHIESRMDVAFVEVDNDVNKEEIVEEEAEEDDDDEVGGGSSGSGANELMIGSS